LIKKAEIESVSAEKYGEVQMTIIGLISPGKIGSSIGAAVSQTATKVIWRVRAVAKRVTPAPRMQA
jgi:hypothetical protein